MDTKQIYNHLKSIKNFIGVFARDRLPSKVNYPCSLVANSDKASEPGTHWIAIVIDENGIGEYFDSFGLPPMYVEFIDFLNNNSKQYFYNERFLQCLTCITCGQYCIAYIKLRYNGYTSKEFIKLFSNDQYVNDKIIKQILYNI
jgi:hypothetical protein